ncbi:putative deoxygluconate dehydrogenase [Klebsiella pneumoniae subsp. pneumoniae]|uniref:Putative deoxygluconate dehydrogenase n=1 Tax=Klebsiella pneumoniae subsp. pneumoniae TaxID=72407 RepID=A0A377ZPE4_KLEPN|nr:putative deoxygluconate dehydrogenase [Klebsiella pneumoniae subsp. pneumoniae]
MLRGKRAVITGGGGGFGQALSVWLAREGVEVDFCARCADDIQKLAVSSRLKVEWRKGISVI